VAENAIVTGDEIGIAERPAGAFRCAQRIEIVLAGPGQQSGKIGDARKDRLYVYEPVGASRGR
jgi:hypothetical protein